MHEKMKKIYIKPDTECVNVRLIGSVMEGEGDTGHFGRYSLVAGGGDDPGFGDGKENSGFFDMGDDFGDTWNDGNSYNLWE